LLQAVVGVETAVVLGFGDTFLDEGLGDVGLVVELEAVGAGAGIHRGEAVAGAVGLENFVGEVVGIGGEGAEFLSGLEKVDFVRVGAAVGEGELEGATVDVLLGGLADADAADFDVVLFDFHEDGINLRASTKRSHAKAAALVIFFDGGARSRSRD